MIKESPKMLSPNVWRERLLLAAIFNGWFSERTFVQGVNNDHNRSLSYHFKMFKMEKTQREFKLRSFLRQTHLKTDSLFVRRKRATVSIFDQQQLASLISSG